MSLSGNLGFVPIDEVLRLLARSHQQGSVEVIGDGLRGRVFVGKGGIDLATTFDDDELHRHLVNSRCADEASLNRVTTGETTLAAIAESNTSLIELLREMSVESLYQINGRGEEFEVREDVTSPYASPKSFELEALLRDAEDRRRQWEEVTDAIPDLTGAVSFRRDLGERGEVTVNVDDWKLLSEIGAGSTVERIAEHLGTTEFWTAQVAARLVNKGLIIVNASPAETVDEYDRGVGSVGTPERPTADQPSYESGTPGTAYEPEPREEPSFSTPEAEEPREASPSESWWQEPRAHEEAESPAPEVASEGLSEMPTVDAPSADEDDVEEDTEAFLEKVFSELESSEDSESPESDEPDSEEGHGLLRRRRMGSLRDFSSDS